ncbi:MAG: MBL fold metallo-hydrolase [Solirubrobacterales bacterium]|nr:MBL fold metallo-hydrolase [Solirubrobacterales bacterium]
MTPEEALARAEEAGIHRLRIPTPFAVGRVNCYLLEGEPLTLVDAGPNSGKALDELEQQLAGLGHAIDDLGLIVVTHQHIDHFGLVDIVASRAGAEVAAIDVVAPFLERYDSDAEREDEFAVELMIRYGIPEELVVPLRAVSRAFRGWGAPVNVTRGLADGETLDIGDRSLEVQLRPGHSPSDTLFWDADRRILICADHLIGHISSNPLLARPLDASNQAPQQRHGSASLRSASRDRPRSLMRYLESLRRTRELPAEVLLPGHGDPITDHVTLIDERFAMHLRRAEKLRRLIAERPRTAYELAQELWGNVAVTQAFLTLSEVVGHVDLLIAEGFVREVSDGDLVRFEATGAGGEVTIPG